MIIYTEGKLIAIPKFLLFSTFEALFGFWNACLRAFWCHDCGQVKETASTELKKKRVLAGDFFIINFVKGSISRASNRKSKNESSQK